MLLYMLASFWCEREKKENSYCLLFEQTWSVSIVIEWMMSYSVHGPTFNKTLEVSFGDAVCNVHSMPHTKAHSIRRYYLSVSAANYPAGIYHQADNLLDCHHSA